MNTVLHTKIQHSGWNKAAPYYETLWQKQLKPSQEQLLSSALINKGDKVLDICCGSGLVTFPIARMVGSQGEVTGTDFSEEMLRIAGSTAKNFELNNVRFLRMKAENLNLPDLQLSVAINSLGLMYLADPQQAIHEMYRVLRPGGKAAVLVWGARKNCGWAEIFPIVDRRVPTEVCPLFFQQGTGQTLLHSFEKAGFEDLKEIRLSDPISFDNENDASDAMFVGGPVALAWKYFDNETRKSARNEYLDYLYAFKNGSGYTVPAEFVIVKGIKK